MLFTPENQRVVDAICRTDFVAFTQKTFQILSPGTVFRMNFHIEALAYILELVRQGKIRRVIVNLPPRSLKSLMISVAWPAFVLGHDPTKHFVFASYGTDLANTLTNQFRMVIDSPSYKRLYPLMQPGIKNTESEVITTQNGYRFATSIDGGLMGRGGDFLIIDDPLKPADAFNDARRSYVNSWFTNTLLTRLDDMTTGAIIVVMQRLHEDDLTGALLRSSKDWVLLSLPAIAEVDQSVQIGPDKFYLFRAGDLLHPERMPRAELEASRSLDPETFAAHYQQNPLPPGGLIIQRSWLRYYDVLPPRNASSVLLQSWDTANKISGTNDWSACTTWLIQDADYYLIDVLRERLDYPSLRERAIAHARTYQADKIVVEEAGIGAGLIQELQKVSLQVVPVRPLRNKITRMQEQSLKFQRGNVYLPRHAPWLSDYQGELLSFPQVRFDDQVDSTSQALAADHSTYDPAALAEGMARFSEALTFEPFIRSLYHSKFG
jgi:predicted phage terminase large subunit-like protein